MPMLTPELPGNLALVTRCSRRSAQSPRWLALSTLLFAGIAGVAIGLPSARAATLPASFSEQTAVVNGVTINYKLGGKGPVVVLLHGYTQTSHMWIPLLPLLATTHTVIAPDLRGAGGSERAPAGYDKKTLARDIRFLLHQLGHDEPVQLVGHDIGLMVAYAYAAQYPGDVSKVILMDAFLPGVGDWAQAWLLRDLTRFPFYGATSGALVKGHERAYFDRFWNDFAADRTKSVPEADRQIYTAAYARTGGIHGGFAHFKTFEQDANDFAGFAATKLAMPFLVLTGEKASGKFLIDQTRLVATNVRGDVIPGAGHWLMEEVPQLVMPAIVAYLNETMVVAQSRRPVLTAPSAPIGLVVTVTP